jgi:hypothetical protein
LAVRQPPRLRESLGVEPQQAIADLKPRVLDTAGEPMKGARCAESEFSTETAVRGGTLAASISRQRACEIFLDQIQVGLPHTTVSIGRLKWSCPTRRSSN